MTDLRTAAQQALEALEWHLERGAYGADIEGVTGNLRAALAQQAEPTGKDSLPVESVVAENATTQQQIEQTPPSDYRRGYWDGFNIGKREGRIEAEDEPAQQAEPVEPVATVTECEACFTPDVCQLRGTCDYYTASQMRIAAPPQQDEPAQEQK